jgi:hypothetical protein
LPPAAGKIPAPGREIKKFEHLRETKDLFGNLAKTSTPSGDLIRLVRLVRTFSTQEKEAANETPGTFRALYSPAAVGSLYTSMGQEYQA